MRFPFAKRPARSHPTRNRRTILRLEGLEGRDCPTAIAADLGYYVPASGSASLNFAASGLNGQANTSFQFQGVTGGVQATDVPVVAGYRGDTMSGIALYRPSTGQWFISSLGNGVVDQVDVFAGSGPLQQLVPVAGDIDGTGYASLGVYHKDTAVWEFLNPHTGGRSNFTFGGISGDVPLLGDFNVDGRADLVVYNPTVSVPDPIYHVAPFNRAGNWRVKINSTNSTTNNTNQPSFAFAFGPFNGAAEMPFISYVTQSPFLHPELGLFTTIGGQTKWMIDNDYDSLPQPDPGQNPDTGDTTYVSAGSAAGDFPLIGNFNAANSIFVSPAGNNNNAGTRTSPLATINAAVQRAPNNQAQIIRVAAGTYSEGLIMFQRSDLTFQGAGPFASVVQPTHGDAFLLNQCNQIWFNGLQLKAIGAGGRGLAMLGSTVATLVIDTSGSNAMGGVSASVANGATVIANFLLAIGSHFDGIVNGDGFAMDGGDHATFGFCTFSGNGGPIQGNDGRGLTLFNDANATITVCAFVQNVDGGIIASGNATLNASQCAFSNNLVGDGVLLQNNVTATITSNYFNHNGQAYGLAPGQGFNGFETNFGYTGRATVSSNTFFDSTAFGVFLSGATQTVNITSNFFDNSNLDAHRVCIGINGALDANNNVTFPTSIATIQGNFLKAFAGSVQEEGIFMLGQGAKATIGGSTGNTLNVFDNFAANDCIDPATNGGGVSQYLGVPTIFNIHNEADANNQNVFMNCGNPHLR